VSETAVARPNAASGVPALVADGRLRPSAVWRMLFLLDLSLPYFVLVASTR
jgi:hypothetical protein